MLNERYRNRIVYLVIAYGFMISMISCGNQVADNNFIEGAKAIETTQDFVKDVKPNLEINVEPPFNNSCGNGICDQDVGENPNNCLKDCKAACGDGFCTEEAGEDHNNCNEDCYISISPCGDGECSEDENPDNCPLDCVCNYDGYCGGEETACSCPVDCEIKVTHPNVIFVNKNAEGDGSNWCHAYHNLQDALDQTNGDGGETTYEIWVATGTYYPDEGNGRTNNNREESFRINRNNVRLYGGFIGHERSFDQRDWVANPTVLSGDIEQDDNNEDGNWVAETWEDIIGNNSYHVLYLDGITNQSINSNTVINGFIITAGNSDAYNYPNQSGGGLLCDGFGTDHECSPTLTNIIFSGNKARVGGGIFNNGFSGGVSSPTMTKVVFNGNYAHLGGGMYNRGVWGASEPILNSVIFVDNYVSYGGAGMQNLNASPTMVNVLFANNHALHLGGGVRNEAEVNGIASPTLVNVTFSGNSAAAGSGVSNEGLSGISNPIITNCILWGNIGNQAIHNVWDAIPIVTYSDVEGGYVGEWNIDADPLFENTAAGNYRLLAGSPAINSGNNTAFPIDLTTLDLDGLNRFIGTIDMGAYEYQNHW